MPTHSGVGILNAHENFCPDGHFAGLPASFGSALHIILSIFFPSQVKYEYEYALFWVVGQLPFIAGTGSGTGPGSGFGVGFGVGAGSELEVIQPAFFNTL
jgi:hypothetical protein